LRDAAELLLLPVRAGLGRLPASVLLRATATRPATAAAQSTVTILPAELLGSARRLLLLEVSEGGEDVLVGDARVARAVGRAIGAAATFGITGGTAVGVGSAGAGRLLAGEDIRLGRRDVLVDLLELQEQVVLQVFAAGATIVRHHVGLSGWVAWVVHVVFRRVLRVLQIVLVHFSEYLFIQ